MADEDRTRDLAMFDQVVATYNGILTETIEDARQLLLSLPDRESVTLQMAASLELVPEVHRLNLLACALLRLADHEEAARG